MAGIYIHIPFCKKVCSYCDFYKTTMVSLMPACLEALKLELSSRIEYLGMENVDTVYFGGGTPSLLTVIQIQEIIDHIGKLYKLSPDAEITIEANPDDLTTGYLNDLSVSHVNRLSIGIQSFNDRYLTVLNRRHNSRRAFDSIRDARNSGFGNISIDLIYGLPEMTVYEWKSALSVVPDVEHISAYHLTIEPGTAFYRKAAAGTLSVPSEESSAQQFLTLQEFAAERNMIHYEISNLGKDGFFSRHNTAYWQRKKYLGAGPSAHSYDKESRQWNVRDVRKYIETVNAGSVFYEREELSVTDRFNEYLMVSLRTIWGTDCSVIKNEFGGEFCEIFKERASHYISTEHIVNTNGIYTMTPSGWLISDHILSELIVSK